MKERGKSSPRITPIITVQEPTASTRSQFPLEWGSEPNLTILALNQPEEILVSVTYVN